MLKSFYLGVFGLFLLFPTIPGLSSAYALTDDFQQWFDSFTAGNPVTNAASLPVTSNWTITFDNSRIHHSHAVTQFNSSTGGPVTSDGLVSYAPVVRWNRLMNTQRSVPHLPPVVLLARR